MKGKYGMRASMLLALVLCCQPADFPAYAEEVKEQAEDHEEKIGLSMGRDLSRILMTKLGLQQAAKEEKKNPALDTKSKKNLKIDPKFLRFDTAAYTYRKEHDLYYTARKLPLKGLLQRTDGVKKTPSGGSGFFRNGHQPKGDSGRTAVEDRGADIELWAQRSDRDGGIGRRVGDRGAAASL